ncbi:MAG: DUF4011 domain-containing protein, partial [Chitinophagia bacterium]|nr:DUF4011 domain-containing protein [Chitinophagia bacterium]
LAAPANWEGGRRPDGIFPPLHATDAVHGLVADDERQRRLRTCLGETDLQAALTGLYRAARLSLEENGANTLYLALGLMRWYESNASERPRLAPVLLMPVELVRRASHRGYVLRSREEETVANVTLLEMLRQDFGITIAGLEQLPRDEAGIDVRSALNLFRLAIRDKSRWDVENTALLGSFSFSRFVMWNDIRTNAARLSSHRIVQSLLEGRLHPDLPVDAHVQAPAAEPPLTEVLLPILADGSQVEAIRAANEGRSFVLHGPPGTGKSQTITNIIANALYRGRRVLFVAEKMAALEVVEKRLEEIGLGDFCLELHSNKTRKSDVLRRIKAMMEAPQMRSRGDFAKEAERIHELRAGLQGYATALHRAQPSGLSVHECIRRYIPHAGAPADIPFEPAFLRALTSTVLTRLEDLADDVQVALRLTGDLSLHPLRQVGLDTYDPSKRETAASLLRSWTEALAALETSFKRVSEALGLSEMPKERGPLDGLAAICRVLTGTSDIRGPILVDEALPQRLAGAERIVLAGTSMLEVAATLDRLFREGWRDLDASALLGEWVEAGQRWFLPRFLIRRRVRGRLSMLSLTGAVTESDVATRLQDMEQWRSRLRAIEEASEELSRLMPTLWAGRDTDWQAVTRFVSAIREVQDAIQHLGSAIVSPASIRSSLAVTLQEGSLAWSAYQGDTARAFIRNHESVVSIEAEVS